MSREHRRVRENWLKVLCGVHFKYHLIIDFSSQVSNVDVAHPDKAKIEVVAAQEASARMLRTRLCEFTHRMRGTQEE